MRYLVTGATGLVGSHVVDRLLARGDAVRALVRQPAAADELGHRGVDGRIGDLTDPAGLAALVDGVDVVVHCAAVVAVTGEGAGLWAVNVEATERLLAAAAAAGLERFIHLSSTAVYGYAPSAIAEDAPKQPTGLYGRSKWAAEERLWQFGAERGLAVVALRPCVIYGERDRHATPVLARLGRMWALPLPAGGRRLLDLVHVADVADAVLSAARSPAAVGHAYNLTDGESHSYRDILLACTQASGRRPAIVAVPSGLFRAATGRGRRLKRLRVLDVDLHYSIEAAARDLDYQPQVGLIAGMTRTLGPARG